MWEFKTLDDWPTMAKSFTGAITQAFKSARVPLDSSHLNNELTDAHRRIQEGSGWCIYSKLSNTYIYFEEIDEFPQFIQWKYTYSFDGSVSDEELLSMLDFIKSFTGTTGIIAVGRKGWVKRLTRIGFEATPLEHGQSGFSILF